MVDRCNALYPALRGDLEGLGTRRGVLTFILNTLIDVEALGFNPQMEGTSPADDLGEAGALMPTQTRVHDGEGGGVMLECDIDTSSLGIPEVRGGSDVSARNLPV
jgi:hypothetical protein